MQNNNDTSFGANRRGNHIAIPIAGAVAGAGGFGGAPAGGVAGAGGFGGAPARAGAGAGVDYRERTPEGQVFPLNPRSRQVDTPPPPHNRNIFIAPPPALVQPPAPVQPPQGAVQPIANQQNLVRSIDSPPPFSPRGY